MKGYILHLHQPSVGEICPWADSYHQNKTATIISHARQHKITYKTHLSRM